MSNLSWYVIYFDNFHILIFYSKLLIIIDLIYYLGKPKIFFIQACQGDKLDGGVHMIRSTETDGDYHQSYKLPLQADFLMMFSTVKGS